MQIAPHITSTLRQMDRWYQTPLGSYVLECERAELDKYLPYYYGEHLLQVGGPSETFLFKRSAIRHRVRMSPETSPIFHGPSVCGSEYALPFLSESIDLMLLPHVLEWVHQPADFFAECDRVLAPEGRLIILSFNPASLWGLRRYLGKKNRAPWSMPFKSKASQQNALQREGFTIEYMTTLLFEPPVTSPAWLKKLFPMEAIGRMCCPDWGAVYMMIAHKSIFSPITLEASGIPSV